jgi:hypothetical protein
MHKIEDTSYGYRMTFEGFFRREDVQRWVDDLRKGVGGRGSFGVFVDMRGSSAFPADAQETLFEGINLCRDKGMDRASIVVANPISKIQAVRITKEVGIQDIVQFIDASSDPDWEKAALDWIQKAVTPR